MNRSRTIISALASLALGSLMASPALGALSASPNPSTTGSYTVSGSVTKAAYHNWVQLVETAPGGTTADFDVADAGNISEAFSGKAVGTYTYQVEGCRHDLDPGNPGSQQPIVICEGIGAPLSVSVVSPPPADLMPDFGDATVSYRSWAQNRAIAAFTVPAASGGDAPLSYSIGGLPAGLSMSGSRTISGTPTASGVGAATVTVRDADGDTDTLRFNWYVGADLTPTFGAAAIADKTFKQNAAIAAFYVPIASGGNWPLSYSATGLPAGVSLAGNRRVSGTPTAHGTGTATVKVTDNDGDTDTLDFDWTVNEDLAPSFATASVADKDWTLRTRIAAFTVPAATGGDGTLRYSASGLPSACGCPPPRGGSRDTQPETTPAPAPPP